MTSYTKKIKDSSDHYIREIEYIYGDLSEEIYFVVEKGVEAYCETGLDTYNIKGNYPDTGIISYEIKDKGCISTYLEYEKMPKQITVIHDALKPALSEYGAKGFISSEIRCGLDKKDYLTDLTLRLPSPPFHLMQLLISNWDEIIYWGSRGVIVNPKYNAKYGIELVMSSDVAKKIVLAIDIPEEIKDYVKLHCYRKLKGKSYVLPQISEEYIVGFVCAIGDTIDECKSKITKYAKMLDHNDLEIDLSVLDYIDKAVEGGEKIGIKF